MATVKWWPSSVHVCGIQWPVVKKQKQKKGFESCRIKEIVANSMAAAMFGSNYMIDIYVFSAQCQTATGKCLHVGSFASDAVCKTK